MINVTTDYGPKNTVEKYPYLGVNEGCIVLFIDNNEGIVLKASTHNTKQIGLYSKFWKESDFTPIEGTVTISNK